MSFEKFSINQPLEISIRLGVVFLIVTWCMLILSPFASMLLWGAIIAVAVYPSFISLTTKLSGQKKLALTIISLIGIAIILLPTIFLTSSLVDSASNLGHSISSGNLKVPPPSESIQTWPLIGEKVYAVWSQASLDLSVVTEKYHDQLVVFGKSFLGMAASTGLSVIQLIISTFIAVAFLANADSASAVMRKLGHRLSSSHGEQLLTMTIFTIRSVAGGLLGIAIFQAILAGIGMALVGIPAAGLLALGVLLLCIAQIPPILLLGPVAFYVFSIETATVATIFLIWCLIVNFSDLVLKPMLLGRGVDAPMLVILLGAIGGMLMSGIIGLFVGAVVLAVGYKLFESWLSVSHSDDMKQSEEV